MAGTNYVWTSATSGDWWSGSWNIPGGFPYGADDTVDLSIAGPAFTVTMHDGTIQTNGGGSETINGYVIGYMKIGASATMLAQTSLLDLASGAANSGTITADYALQVGDDTANAVVSITSLTGATGHIVLNGATGATLTGHSTGIELDLHGQSLEGSGSVTGLRLKVFDDSRINANVAGQTLTLSTGDDILNSGVLGATSGGVLAITGSTIRQAAFTSGGVSGSISAADKSTITLSSDTIVGGAVSTTGSGIVQAGDSSDILDGSTSAGAVTLTNGLSGAGYNILLKGLISNQGALTETSATIYIDAAASATFNSAGSATKGQVKLVGAIINTTANTANGSALYNVDNQFVGYGNYYNLVFTNESGGVIDANVAGQSLSIDSSDTLLNKGLVEATNGGILDLFNQQIDAALGGTVTAGVKSTVALQSTTFLGGTLSVSAGGQFALQDGGTVLDGSTTSGAVTLAQSFTTAGYNLTLKGTLHNEGTLAVPAATLEIAAAGATLDSNGASVKGQVSLVAGAINSLANTSQGSALDNIDNQIVGYGNLYNLKFTNESGGIVNANVNGQTLYIDGSDLLINKGTLKATNGGNLGIASQTLDASLGGRVFSGQFSKIYISSDTFLGGLQYGDFAFQDGGNVFDGSTASGAVTFVNPLDTGGYNLTLKGAIHNWQLITAQSTTIEIDAAGVTLDNAGTTNTSFINLVGANINSVANTALGSSLDLSKSEIEGYGAFYNLKFTNDVGGVVNANVAGQTLSIGSSDSVTNKGLLEATGGGTLDLSSQSVDSALGGTLTAGANSTVALASTTILGGTLAAGSGGKFVLTDGSVVFDGSTKSGAVTLAQSFDTTGYNLNVKGTLHNKGVISLAGATLEIDAAGVTLDSGGATVKGQISLTGANINSLANTAQGSALDNVDNQIVGYGNLYNLKLTNEAGGVIDADVSGQALSIDGSDLLVNKGLLEATAGGTLVLASQNIDSALGGTVTAGANSTVSLASTTFTGGTLAAGAGGKFVLTDGNVVLDGSTKSGAVTLAQSFDTTGYDLNLKGALHNKGTISLANTTLEIDAAGVTLDSGGAAVKGHVALTGATINSLANTAQGSALDNIDNQIFGYGFLYNLKFTNEAGGSVNANVAGQALSLDGSDSVTNKGLLEATSGVLNLSGGFYFNAGGTIWANGGTVNLSSMVVRQGTLRATGASRTVIADNNVSMNSGTVTDGLSILGGVVVSDGLTLTMSGSIIDNGHIYLGDASGGSSLYLGATLDGTGSIVMAANEANQISGAINNVRSTIVGGGLISASLQQAAKGVIDATSGLTLSSGHAVANAGLLEAVGGVLSVEDAVTGAGTASVSGGGTLSFASTFNENVTFAGAGRLSLEQAYSGVLSGFTIGDQLDLGNIAYSAGEHVVWRGVLAGVQSYWVESASNAVLATLHFKGDYSPGFFSVTANAGFAEVTVHHAPLSSVATNDFNGDATSDILWTNVGSNTVQDWTVVKGAEFGSHTGPALTAGYTLAGTGDFNGDGSTDLLLTNATNGAVQEWDSLNGAYFKTHALGAEAPSTGWAVEGTGDFNGDGNSDIFWVNNSTHQTMVWEERNDALLGTTTAAGPGAGWSVVGTGDFNADGVTDVLWANASSQSVLDWQMSAGTFKSSSVLGTVATGSTLEGVGDFDGKGADEVLFQSSTGALSAWQIVNGANVGTLSLSAGLPAGFAVAKVGDFNGDGISDVLAYNSSTGAVDVGLVSGGVIAKWASVGTQAAGQWHLAA